MAWSEVTTKIANPATGRKRKKTMAAKRHLSARKASLRAKRHAPAKKQHRAAPRPKVRKKSSHRSRTVKRNLAPAIIALELGNPAQRRQTTMATHRTKTRASAKHRNNAGRPAHRSKAVMHHRRRTRNPAGLGRPMDWVMGGAGVLGGVVVTRALPQLVLATKNTGPVGYFANAVAAAGAGWLAHVLLKKPVLTASVIAGGFAALIARIISDQTQYGKFLSLTGLGDYHMFNFASPQRLGRDLRSVEIPSGWGAPAITAAPGGGLAGGMDSASIC